MAFNPFINARRKLRNGWWIAIFFALLTALLLPLILVSSNDGGGVPIYQQAAVVLVASLICQALRRRPLDELFGAFNWRWPRELLLGLAAGALLMAIPAAVLAISGLATWQLGPHGWSAVGATLAVLAAAAATEELLFRGFLFQRLLDGLGEWPAQLLIAALFTLTHSDALKEIGAHGFLAGVNIFVASIMFGLAYVRTRSLALPLGLHFAANAMQGPVLGFGVSGADEPSMLALHLAEGSDWITGGTFGLEASVPGLIAVLALTFLIWRSPASSPSSANR